MDRRSFIKSCSTIAVVSAIEPTFFSKLLAQENSYITQFKKALLIKENGEPIKEKDLQPFKQYIFFYPYKSTPCYIINLDTEIKPVEVKLVDGGSYKWNGGVGSKKSIVAYSAICSHQWMYPTKDFSMLNYYPPTEKSQTTEKSNIIQCCAHMSIFDPQKGCEVLEGPAPYPLASIVLTVEDDKIYANAVLGRHQFEEFFDLYKSDLIQQYGSINAAKELIEKATVMEVGSYVKEQIKC